MEFYFLGGQSALVLSTVIIFTVLVSAWKILAVNREQLVLTHLHESSATAVDSCCSSSGWLSVVVNRSMILFSSISDFTAAENFLVSPFRLRMNFSLICGFRE